MAGCSMIRKSEPRSGLGSHETHEKARLHALAQRRIRAVDFRESTGASGFGCLLDPVQTYVKPPVAANRDDHSAARYVPLRASRRHTLLI